MQAPRPPSSDISMNTVALSDASTHTQPSHDQEDQDIVMPSMPAPRNDFPMIASVISPPTPSTNEDNIRRWTDVDGMWTWAPQAPHHTTSAPPHTQAPPLPPTQQHQPPNCQQLTHQINALQNAAPPMPQRFSEGRPPPTQPPMQQTHHLMPQTQQHQAHQVPQPQPQPQLQPQ